MNDCKKYIKVYIPSRCGTVGAVAECLTAALRIVGSFPARNKYLYGQQVVVPGPNLNSHNNMMNN